MVHALPSVKALAQAFLLTSKRMQPERRWRAKVIDITYIQLYSSLIVYISDIAASGQVNEIST